MNETETPRTDAVLQSCEQNTTDVGIADLHIMFIHAEQLERELNEARKQLDDCHADYEITKAERDDYRRQLNELIEHVGLCHDTLGESRDSDTSELWKAFAGQKSLIARCIKAESEIATLREEKLNNPFCAACKEPDCFVSGDGTCAMIRKYQSVIIEENDKQPTNHEEWGDEQSMEGGEQ